MRRKNMKLRHLGIVAVCFFIGICSFADTADKWSKGEKQQDGTTVYEGKQSAFAIHCSLSGGMRQIIYDKYLFTFIETIEKKDDDPSHPHVVSASLQSFVEVQKKTQLIFDQEQKLRDWIIKFNISSIKPVPKPEKEDMGAIRYTNRLTIYMGSQKIDLDHRTIAAHPELIQAFDELFAMAREFTDIIHEKKVETGLLQGNLNEATTVFAYMMRNEKQFAFLAGFSIDQPERYTELMNEFEKQRKQGNQFGWDGVAMNPYSRFGDYLNERIENDQGFAKESAMAWEKGWGLTISEVIPKLDTKNFAGTRRIAIEFLKMKNSGEDFGYIWKDEPETFQNKSAIAKWNGWFKNNKQLSK
jgi:hypothetical protein